MAAQLNSWPPTATARPSTKTVGASAGLGGEAFELAALAVEKAAPLHQILRRIAADGLFGKRRRA